MDEYKEVMQLFMDYVKEVGKKEAYEVDDKIPVGISNRHVHLSRQDLDVLFGAGYELTKLKDLSQPGQYACKEMVTICGPKGAMEKVRILGPVRSKTQVEVLAGDCYKLGVKAEARLSGDLDGTSKITIIGSKGSVQIQEGLIIAWRHIHMLPEDAKRFEVQDGQNVKIEVDGIRGGIFYNVMIRVTKESQLEFHVDTEEANAMGISSSSIIKIVS